MPLPILPVAGAALGGIKSIFDLLSADKQRHVQAETTRFSPWTHMQAPAPNEANPIGNILQGGFTGLALDQNAKALKAMGKNAVPATAPAQFNSIMPNGVVPQTPQEIPMANGNASAWALKMLQNKFGG